MKNINYWRVTKFFDPHLEFTTYKEVITYALKWLSQHYEVVLDVDINDAQRSYSALLICENLLPSTLNCRCISNNSEEEAIEGLLELFVNRQLDLFSTPSILDYNHDNEINYEKYIKP